MPIRRTSELNLGFNIGFNRNEIDLTRDHGGLRTGFRHGPLTEIGNDYWISVGGSVGQMYGYKSDGRYEVSDFIYNASDDTWTLKENIADATSIVGTLRPGKLKMETSPVTG
ncbi:MAG: hypothetical protein MZV63_67640 [Marinilabiliales bacterium]|nr:hypothetical protein [Marinilabiliales bacterium]